MIAFEYQPPSERNGQTVSLHNNYYDERTGTFDHPLFSNGYFPLALISEDVSKSDEWDKFCDWLYVEQPSVQDAVRAAYTVINRFRRLPSIPELDNRTASQKDEQVAAQYNTAQRILAALLAGRIVSQRNSAEFKTTAFHSRMADVRRILTRQYPDRTLCSRYTEDHLTEAGRPFKLYWLA